MNNIIINADDFGLNKDTFESTISLFEKRLITSASIMCGCSYTDNALNFAKLLSTHSFGIHLNFVDKFKPLSNLLLINSIIDSNGLFYNSNSLRLKALFKCIKREDLIAEASMQIEYLLDKGIIISHIDSHGHMHKYPIIRDAVLYVMGKYNISKIRNVQNIKNGKFFLPFFRSFNLPGLKTTDYLYMPNTINSWSIDLNSTLNITKSKVIEIGIHPGFEENWRRNETNMLHTFHEFIAQRNDCNLINWNYL